MTGSRPAFTLIEVLLVLVVLMVSAALIAPAFTGGEAQSQLRDAASQLETAWARARLDAMASGRPLVFRCEVGGQRGVISSPMVTAIASPQQAAAGQAAPNTQELQFTDVTYQSLQVAEPAGATPVGLNVAEGETSSAVVFHPDGATSDAEATLINSQGQRLKVTLRGLTGATRVEQVTSSVAGAATGAN